MKDENPNCLPEHKYKAVMFFENASDFANFDDNKPTKALTYLVSKDGIHFEKQSVISQGFEYDSQNTLHWNPHTNKYYCYFRYFKDYTQQETAEEMGINQVKVSRLESSSKRKIKEYICA